MSINLKEHLNLLKIKDIKGLIRQFNLHYKIKLSQKKPELISDLLKHFEENIIDNNITSKKYEAALPKIEEPKLKPKINKNIKEVPIKEFIWSEDTHKLFKNLRDDIKSSLDNSDINLQNIKNLLIDNFIKSFKRKPSKQKIQDFIYDELEHDDEYITAKEKHSTLQKEFNDISFITNHYFRINPLYKKKYDDEGWRRSSPRVKALFLTTLNFLEKSKK